MQELTGRLVDEIDDTIKSPPSGQVPVRVEPGPAPPAKSDPLKSQLDTFFNRPDVTQLLTGMDSEELAPICYWLARLYLLYGVPFHHLVVDEKMLPEESVRFFYLDRNWLEFLVKGAMSIGIQTSRDAVQNKIMRDTVMDTVNRLVDSMRDSFLGITGSTPGGQGETEMAGLLLRSAVVSGWPGLEIRGYKSYSDSTPSEPVRLLRMDHLSKDVLLCIFAETPEWIEIDEPKESLHFGVEVNDQVYLRNIGPTGTGQPLNKSVTAHYHKNFTLRIQDLRKEMQSYFPGVKNRALYPSEFALQMVVAPERMVFRT